MIKEKVYLETSVISYLTARPSLDIVKLAKQELTRQWWEKNKSAYDFYISDPVLAEIRRGDAEAAQHRMSIVTELPTLDVNEEVVDLHERFFSGKILPNKARADAMHIALAAVHGMTFLATWNCKHINNATLKRKISDVTVRAGYHEVFMATPEELWRSIL